jgi:uncharacterized protein (DUF2236 family)
MVFGSEDLAARVGERVRRIHSYVVGPSYSANDPEHLLWVHATLVDTALRCHTLLVGPLSREDEETYYRQMMRVASAFGLPMAEQPPTFGAFRAWFDAEVGTMQPSDASRELARFISSPRLPLSLHVPLAPLVRVQSLFAVGTLPARLRDELGFSWSSGDQRRLDALVAIVRSVFRTTPRPLRVAPSRLNTKQLLWSASRRVAA